MRRLAGISVPLSPVPLLCSEEQCVAYLTARARRANRLCPRCGWRRGYWLAGRQRWQCERCGGQFGLRAGTVMEGSRLPLKVWMIAIQTILDNYAISLRRLRPLWVFAACGRFVGSPGKCGERWTRSARANSLRD